VCVCHAPVSETRTNESLRQRESGMSRWVCFLLVVKFPFIPLRVYVCISCYTRDNSKGPLCEFLLFLSLSCLTKISTNSKFRGRSVWQCVAVCLCVCVRACVRVCVLYFSVLQCIAVCYSVTVFYSVLQCVAVCCSNLQCVAVSWL